ncbi:small subunit processome component 20 homolog [Dermacentor silvarum]|uniref:small subunit processome component 20 homolog n=1 Tax=Dermacentor silvarum TaxID=543639 RepID=UPI002100F8D0|nr:small subunit processome component 20 homolog [Dermacentor silvarum]
MKNKPVKHKAENTFRFQSFSERLSNINIDVIHRVGPHRRTTPFESETFVEEALAKWSELNCTEDYDKLRNDIGSEIHTLPQIVLRKDALLEIIKTQLGNRENKALDAVLDITVALARDLQYDFYPSFPEVFRLVCAHLDTRDPEMLERIFVCLSYLFKFLWRYMVRDIDLIFKLYVPLLGSQQKKYVRDFAAESFAFLIRKVSDKEKLVDMMLAYLEANPQSTDGIGRLLFEAVKGVRGQTHSCMTVVLPLALKRLDGSVCSGAVACQALRQTFVALAEHLASHAENSSAVWNCLKEVVADAVEKYKSDKESVLALLENLATMVKIWVLFKRGLLSRRSDAVYEILDLLLELGEASPALTATLLECLASLVTNGGTPVSPSSGPLNKLVEKVYSGSFSAGTVFDFTGQVVECPAFEKDVLCHVVQHCASFEDRTHALSLLAEVVLQRRPMPGTADELIRSWRPLPLCISGGARQGFLGMQPGLHPVAVNGEEQEGGGNLSLTHCQFCRENVVSLAQTVLEALAKDVTDPLLWAGLVCLPHLSAWGDVVELQKALDRILQELRDRLQLETLPASSAARLSFVFLQAVATAALCKFEGALANITSDVLINILRQSPENVCLLKAADIFLVHAAKRVSPTEQQPKEDLLRSFYSIIERNLASPHGVVRLLTLRVLSSFGPKASPEPREKDEKLEEFASACHVFNICLSAEAVPLTVQDYRERLKLLQALSSEQLAAAAVSLGAYSMAPVHYLLGTLLVNFQLLWKPCQEILASHASADGPFWSTLVQHLTIVYDKIETSVPATSEDQSGVDSLANAGLAGVFDEAQEAATKLADKPDYVNHRHLLWNAAEQFAGVAERRSRDVVTFFYRFLEKEFWPNMQMAPHHDIRKPEDTPVLPADGVENKPENPQEASVIIVGVDEPQDDAEEDENADDREEEDVPVEEVQHIPSRARLKLVRSLCDHLRLLSKFSNPRAVSKHELLYETYLDLLTFRDPEVQKLAFACIVGYGQKFLTPYRENFERLLDEASFRSEVVLFNVDDGGEGAVRAEHRTDIVPILMRVLYGKMHTRSGSATGGKSSFSNRQGTVLRFLASCQESELGAFMDLELATLKQYLSDGIMDTVNNIRDNLDLSKVVPIRRLHGTLGTVENMLRHLGALTPGLLPTLLKLLVAVATYAGAILSQKDRVVRAVISNTRVLRSRVIGLVSQFFERFDTYEFTSAEIDAIFESAVWPQLPHLAELAGKQKPNPLLKFFLALSRNPRYFVLFAKYKADDLSTSPLPCLVSLLGNSDISPSILKVLLMIIDNILTLREGDHDDVEDGKRAPPLVVSHCFDVEARRSTAGFPEKSDGEDHYGALLMLPYVPHILHKLKSIVESAVRTQKPLSPVELNILLRISGLLTNSQQCAELAKLFVVGFKKLRSQAQDSDQQKLATVLNLAKVADNPDQLLGYTATLFSSLANNQSRRLLCDIYGVVAERVPRFAELASFIAKVNSWNPRFAEEPNYQTRLEGFKMAAPLVLGQKEEPDVRIVLAVIYNCTYTIRAVDDLALRDAASHALAQMGPVFQAWLKEDRASYEKCVTEALMGEIRQGLRGKSEHSRVEFVRVLSQLLQHCSEHPSLTGLSQLCCRQDVELDFWENLCHIQLHRRARALNRLAVALRAGELTSLTPPAISGVLLPLSSCYLFNSTYTKQTALVDAAIEAVSSLCSRLPWRHYEANLSRYIQLLQRDTEYHKMAIRLVVAILDAFHFDLSKSKGIRQKPGAAKPARDAVQAEGATAQGEVEEMEVDTEQTENVDENEVPQVNGEVEETSVDNKDKALNEDAATAIHTAIATRLLPRLHKVLNQKARADDEHKAAKIRLPEEHEILRIPIAVAMVKLLQALPDGMLQRHLPGVFLRICDFLKSRSRDVREAARGTLVKVMSSLGAPYLKYLFSQMRGVLKRGYQIHVLTYTVHAVLSSMSSGLVSGDLDACFEDIIEVCQAELFSDIAEEKEVAQIGSKVREAKATKSFAIYNILASVASRDTLRQLTPALLEVLLSTTSHKTVKKCDDCLHNIVMGLSANKGLPVEDLLIYTYQTISQHAPSLLEKPREPVPEPRLLEEKSDVYLVPQEPARSGMPVRTSKTANGHVMVEFGLKIVHSILKKEQSGVPDQKQLEMLDPYVGMLASFLDSSCVKMVTISLRCFGPLLRMPLPGLRQHMRKLSQSLFVLLHKYSGAGMKQGPNFELLVLAFKVMTTLVRDPSLCRLSKQQLLVLLTYVERDVYDHSRQSVAFALLKAILHRRVDTEELHDLMDKVATMSIEDEQAHIRGQCREAYLQYVLDYPMKRRMKKAVGFFTAQLEYSTEAGRLSALEMLDAYSNKFPQHTLSHYAPTLFVPMAACLVNDQSPNVQRVAAAGIRSLLGKLDEASRNPLLSVVLAWCKEKMFATRRLGAQTLGLFAEVEKERFERHLADVMPVLVEEMHPDKFEELTVQDIERAKDHIAFMYLVSLTKIVDACNVARAPATQESFGRLCGYAETYLLYPHDWVRLAASQFYGRVFAAYTPDEVAAACDPDARAPSSRDYLLVDTPSKVRSLTEKSCSQFQPDNVLEKIAEQVIRNLVFLTRVSTRATRLGIDTLHPVDWIVKKVSQQAHAEVVSNPRSVVKGLVAPMCSSILAAISLDLTRPELHSHLQVILTPICRELEDQSPSQNEEMKQMANEATAVIKKAAGVEAFGAALVALQGKLAGKKLNRKREKALEMVRNPEAGARKKMKLQLRKKEALKRKKSVQFGKVKRRKAT